MSTDTGSAGVKRRDFLKVLGAAGATGATIGCSSEKVEKLIPYLVQPDNTVPGVSNYYATVVHDCAAGCGVIAEVRDGRAIKLEGNPAHPLNQGAICARCQASLQGLYNPDRYRGPMMRAAGGALAPVTWEQALQALQQRLGANAASAVFINQAESGSFPALLDQWLAANGMPAHVAYDADAPLGAIEANRQTYGVAWPSIDFTQARLVVSIGADFLDGWGPTVPLQLSWADARAQMQDAPRMVYIGARRSLTGLNADEWIAARPGSELALVNALRDAAGGNAGGLAAAAAAAGVEVAQLQRLAAEMASARPAVVLAGTTGADATQVALAANAINATTGAVGTVLRPDRAVTSMVGSASIAELRTIVQRMAAGQVRVLFVRGANPVFTTPPALGFAEAMTNAQDLFKVSFSSYPDETSALCDLILPDHHALESWGDTQPLAGTVAFQQPTMNPVFNTRQTADVLIALGRGTAAAAGNFPQPTYREWLAERNGGAMAFAESLASGVASGTTLARTAPAAAPAATPAQAAPAIGTTEGNFFLVVYPSPLLGTGAGANKPWLQELADPVTKIAWQSWVELHPLTAREMNVRAGDHVTVRTATGSLTAPAYPYLGIRRDTVAVALGRGHTEYGRYARGIGVNPLAIVPAVDDAQSGALALTVTRAQVTAAGEQSELVTTEGSARQHGRGIAQAVSAVELGAGVAVPVTPVEGGSAATTTPPQGEGVGSGQLGSGVQPGGVATPVPTAPAVGDSVTHGAPAGAEGAAGEHGGGHDIPGLASHEFLPGLRSPVAGEAQGNFIDSTSKDLGMYDPDHWSRMARRRWAMTIDLARCTGCSACVVACYAENNIPTVGAPYQGRALSPFTWDERPGANIVKGREMTWIRLERYFEGGEDGSSDFETRFVPMLCQHCGNAPCEPVCPVYATYHSPDGLNVQVYNRCVGTRYCSNNCPYKVRYFNWFGYGEPERRQYAWPEPLNWQLNPDVTVRGKGVMEKCTFCVQRIRESEHRARLEGREVQADEFTTACAQACPSRAITFGDAADATWSVAQLAVDRRAYHVFEELNTYTAVVYLKKVLHPAPAPATA